MIVFEQKVYLQSDGGLRRIFNRFFHGGLLRAERVEDRDQNLTIGYYDDEEDWNLILTSERKVHIHVTLSSALPSAALVVSQFQDPAQPIRHLGLVLLPPMIKCPRLNLAVSRESIKVSRESVEVSRESVQARRESVEVRGEAVEVRPQKVSRS